MGKRRGWDGMAGKEKEGRVGGRGREGRGKGRGCGGAQKVVCPGARAGSRRAWGEREEKREGKGRAIKTPLLNGLATGLLLYPRLYLTTRATPQRYPYRSVRRMCALIGLQLPRRVVHGGLRYVVCLYGLSFGT